MNRKLFITPVLFLLFCAAASFAQTVETNKKDEISPELRKEAIVFLRETALEVNNLRTLENRVGFSGEIAGLMWFNDEKEARQMFQSVVNDFRQLLADYDARLNALDSASETVDAEDASDSGDKLQITRKFAKAAAVRQQLALAIAEHDAELAFEFFASTASAITNEKFRKQIEASDVYFETRLLNQIAAKNVDAALKYGRKVLAKGFNYELVSLLQKIYDKDAEKGAAFGEDIISRIKSDASKPDSFYYLTRVLRVGIENLDRIKGKTGARPMFSESALRDVAELEAQEILKREDAEGAELESYLDDIERVLPARAAQIRQKLGIKKKIAKAAANGVGVQIVEAPMPKESPDETIVGGKKQSDEILKSSEGNKLSDEDRKKILDQSKRIISETKDRNEKILSLIGLAIQVAKVGDKELAADLMKQVQTLINPTPKNYRDFMEIWMLVGGYAQTDAERAFPILEDTIFRLNNTLGAFVRVGEFIDVEGDMIDDGEVQIGGFGGSVVRDLLQGLGAADQTVKNLAIADFTKTKNLTNKFDRQEVRLLAKMLVLRAVLGDKKDAKEDF